MDFEGAGLELAVASRHWHWVVATAGAVVLAYSFLVLGFVVTCPDLRLRALLVDPKEARADHGGILIQPAVGLNAWRGPEPQAGDRLLRLGQREVQTVLDLTLELESLRNREVIQGYDAYDLDLPDEPPVDTRLIQSLPEQGRRRFLQVEFLRRGETEPVTAWLEIQSLPARDILLSLIGFAVELIVFAVAAIACWHRPFDRSVRLFLAMCVVTLGAFVGGSHWWILAGRPWLVAPFAVCAMLVPVISLHFFLVYPRTNPAVVRFPRAAIVGVYLVPVLAVAAVLGLIGATARLHSSEQPAQNLTDVLETLDLLQRGVRAYLMIAAAYFGLQLLTLGYSYATARSTTERNQLRWIGGAAVVAALFIAYSLYLALARREDFARGAAKLPMFLANISFILAYAVAIVRHKLLLMDQLVGRGVLYWVSSIGLTLSLSLAIGLSILVPQLLNISLLSHQAWLVSMVLTATVMLLLWLRDRVQQAIDRRFYREKYRLDKALQRINRAAGHVGEPAALAAMMLTSCRDVLGVARGGLYLRSSDQGPFQLIAAEDADHLPARLAADEPWIEALAASGSVQRITAGSRRDFSPVQRLLHELHGELIHALQVDRTVAGLVVLGEKKVRGPFTAEDLTFLDALSQMTHVALHSARAIDENLSRMNEELRGKLQKISEQKRQIELLQAELTRVQQPAVRAAGDDAEFRREAIKGRSAAIAQVLETARKVASSQSSVLIRGESGTGKELLAQLLHDNSPRRDAPLVRVHCASLSPTLLESELFGHVKGAFTGAHRDKIGRFEAANGGTLFLDEIGDISLETQIKLLRVLQERCFEPVGGTQSVRVDVRLITATHQNLERLIAAGTFREDLYYRLNVISLTLPPLRERPDDILELALHFLNRSAARLGKRISHFDEDALAALQQHRWPGNIRELENVIERAVVLAESDRITVRELPADFSRPAHAAHIVSNAKSPAPVRAARRLATVPAGAGPAGSEDVARERELLRRSLQQCGGNKAEAARLLGLPRSTFFSKLRKHGLT